MTSPDTSGAPMAVQRWGRVGSDENLSVMPMLPPRTGQAAFAIALSAGSVAGPKDALSVGPVAGLNADLVMVG